MANERAQVVVIEGDGGDRALLSAMLTDLGHGVEAFPDGPAALQALRAAENPDLLLSELPVPGPRGADFLSELKKIAPDVPVVLITPTGRIEDAIAGIRNGAYDYLVKPFKQAEIQVTVDRALEYRKLQRDNFALRRAVRREWTLGDLIGKSKAMTSLFELVGRISHATANVLITGECGTGKELVAREIHKLGPRASKPFLALGCTAIPDHLLESELFGHAEESLAGAPKPGLFEQAHGGTLFLDEIGDLNPALQAKLLRVLQEKKIQPVGSDTWKDVDVRVVAATHKDLKSAIRDGRFREDLYYRLSVIPIVLPPLRHRKEDIPVLAEYFRKKYTATNQAEVRGFTQKAMEKLMSRRWEGNVRELENVIERAVVLCQAALIDAADIPNPEMSDPESFFASATSQFPTLAQLEQRYIELVLEKTGGRKDKAANILGINRRTLYRKEREYGWAIRAEETEPEEFPEMPPMDTARPRELD